MAQKPRTTKQRKKDFEEFTKNLKPEIAYPDALKYIINIRTDRQGNWEEDWRTYSTLIRGGIIDLKTTRITTQATKIIRQQPHDKEALIDSLADLANYTLFWLQILLEKEEQELEKLCPKPIQEYTNKSWEEKTAKNFPETCGNKKCKYKQNLIKETLPSGLGPIIIVTCPKCNWVKEITPWELI